MNIRSKGSLLMKTEPIMIFKVYGNMCAKYMFRGKDRDGNPCQLFVKNDSYLAPIMRNEPYFDGCPMFLTDSPVLGKYLCAQHFRSEVHGKEWGVEIRIFDVLSEAQ